MSILAPLLRPAAWRLVPGAADAPIIRLCGQLLILTSGAAMLAWSTAIWHSAWLQRRVDLATCAAVLLCLLWGAGARWLWLRWVGRSASLTLRWTGPVSEVPLRVAAPTAPAAPRLTWVGGWRVDEWGDAPVQVELVWDWQRVLLVRLRSNDASGPEAWVWLSDRLGNEVHRLRTLLCLPSATTTAASAVSQPVTDSRAQAGRKGSRWRALMASSVPLFAKRSGLSADAPHMPSRPRSTGGPASQRSARAQAHLSRPLRIEDDFPATQLFDRDAAEPEPRAIQLGQVVRDAA